MSSRKEMLYDLGKVKLPIGVVPYVAKLTRSDYSLKAKGDKLLESLSDAALKVLHDAFVSISKDKTGKSLELRLAQVLAKEGEVVDIKFRQKLIGKSRAIHEIDVVGYDEDEMVESIGEAKDRASVTKDQVLKWVEEVRDILQNDDYKESLSYALFHSSGYYQEDVIKMLKSEFGEDGKLKTGFFGPYVRMRFYEEREGKVHKVYPR
jgi:hypothetical protein